MKHGHGRIQAPQHLEVTEWTSPPLTVRQNAYSKDVWIPRAMGGTAVVAVHALLVLSLHAATAVLPAKTGMTGSADSSGLVITLIDKPQRADELSPDGVRPVLLPPISMPLSIAPPPALRVRLALNDEISQEGAADPALREASEIYNRQISARVNRLWEQPNPAEVGRQAANDFECTVQLEQDTDGNVKEVLLQRCNGSDAWRQSLLTAVRSASPLPAPPDRQVFQSSLVLAFAANASLSQ